MSRDLSAQVDHLMTLGYCVLEDRIPKEIAASMAQRFLGLHADPKYRAYIVGDEYYQTLFGMMNLDDRVWTCVSHPDVVGIARRILGPNCRAVEACSKPTWPGAPARELHVDSAKEFARVPDVPWMINTMWMLTDFTVENGATGVVPMSHHSRLKQPPSSITPDHPLVKPITGRAGSVLLWHAGAFHVARANTSEQLRHGLNIAYYPRWMNHWIESGYQPLWPKTYERMPDEMKRLCPGLRGRERAERYERFG